jgi:hypothetical protein
MFLLYTPGRPSSHFKAYHLARGGGALAGSDEDRIDESSKITNCSSHHEVPQQVGESQSQTPLKEMGRDCVPYFFERPTKAVGGYE